jgi:hypothetical protein
MSERFVEGFIVSAKKLARMVGTPALAPNAVKTKLKGNPILRDVIMTLARGDDDPGPVDTALGALASGTPKPEAAYALARVTALVLHAYAEPLGTLEANYMPSDGFGLWTPVFRALAMNTIAKQWAKPTLAFPFARPSINVSWPIITYVDAESLADWKRELAGKWADKLAALPLTELDPEATGSFTRDQARAGIATLAKWVKRATGKVAARPATELADNGLVLILDGDQ